MQSSQTYSFSKINIHAVNILCRISFHTITRLW